MITAINRTKEITDQLKKTGHVRDLSSSEDMQALIALNSAMDIVRRDYKVKSQNSLASAAKTILTV